MGEHKERMQDRRAAVKTDWKLRDRSAEEAIAQHYDLLYYRTRFAKSLFMDFSRAVRGRARRGTILDLGCGTGILCQLLESPSIEMFCLDFSGQMLKIAKTRCPQCIEGDVESLPVKDSSFNVVCCHSMLHHLPKLSQTLSEAYRVLRSGGSLILEEPNSHHIRRDLFLRILEFAFRRLGVALYEDMSNLETDPGEHHGPIRLQGIVSAMEKAGFTIDARGYRYYSSYILSCYDNAVAHALGRLLDPLYLRRNEDGYMLLVIGKKP